MSNSSFHGDLGRQLGAMNVLDDRIAEVVRVHAGRPVGELEDALRAAISCTGAHPDDTRVAELAQDISMRDECPGE